MSWDKILKGRTFLDFDTKRNLTMYIENHPTLDDWNYDLIAKAFVEKYGSDDTEVRLEINEVVVEGELSGFTKDEEEKVIELKEFLTKDEIEIDFAFKERLSSKGNELNIFISKFSAEIELDYQKTEDIKKAYCTLILTYTNS